MRLALLVADVDLFGLDTGGGGGAPAAGPTCVKTQVCDGSQSGGIIVNCGFMQLNGKVRNCEEQSDELEMRYFRS